jgi:hypothetical protein
MQTTNAKLLTIQIKQQNNQHIIQKSYLLVIFVTLNADIKEIMIDISSQSNTNFGQMTTKTKTTKMTTK